MVATSHLVGVKKGAGRVLAPAYLGWARPRHHPRLPSTGCAWWGLVTWRSSVLLVVVVGDDGCRVSPCRHVSSASSCVVGASLFWMVVGDGWRRQWWWWEGRSGVAMFEPRLPYLGGQVLRVGCISLLFYV